MTTLTRLTIALALVAFAPITAHAADKPCNVLSPGPDLRCKIVVEQVSELCREETSMMERLDCSVRELPAALRRYLEREAMPAIPGGGAIPIEYRGEWCAKGDDGNFLPRAQILARVLQPGDCADVRLAKLTADSIVFYENVECRLTKIKSIDVGKARPLSGTFLCPNDPGRLIRFTLDTSVSPYEYAPKPSRRLYIEVVQQ